MCAKLQDSKFRKHQKAAVKGIVKFLIRATKQSGYCRKQADLIALDFEICD
jgi:hypothetical protein